MEYNGLKVIRNKINHEEKYLIIKIITNERPLLISQGLFYSNCLQVFNCFHKCEPIIALYLFLGQQDFPPLNVPLRNAQLRRRKLVSFLFV